MKKKRTKNHKQVLDILKRARKESREAEIKAHGTPLPQHKVQQSKKVYNRKREKRKGLEDSF